MQLFHAVEDDRFIDFGEHVGEEFRPAGEQLKVAHAEYADGVETTSARPVGHSVAPVLELCYEQILLRIRLGDTLWQKKRKDHDCNL